MTEQPVVAIRLTSNDRRIMRRIRAHAIVTVGLDITDSQVLRAALNAWELQHPADEAMIQSQKKGERTT